MTPSSAIDFVPQRKARNGPGRTPIVSEGTGQGPVDRRKDDLLSYPASRSIQPPPQIVSARARNTLSGRTLPATSRNREKSRGDSRRKRTAVSPGFLRNNSW